LLRHLPRPCPSHFISRIVTAWLLQLAIKDVTQQRKFVDGRQFAHPLAPILSANIGVEPVPYDAGNFIGRHCHTIASGCGEIVYALRPLVSSPGLTAYERR